MLSVPRRDIEMKARLFPPKPVNSATSPTSVGRNCRPHVVEEPVDGIGPLSFHTSRTSSESMNEV